MNVYSFDKLEKCYVCGNIDRNFDKFIKALSHNLKHFAKEEHPKEIERQERLKKRAEHERAFLHEAPRIRRGMAEAPRPIAEWGSPVSSSKKMKSCYKSPMDCSYNDSVIIVSGNCGIGGKSIEYYKEKFGKLDKILADNNTFLLFVRGNNDDPSFFSDKAIDFEHVKTLPDYSVVQLKSFNCLCIGGSVSIDKEWKLAQEEAFGKKCFWEGEAPYFDEKALDEILSKFQIDCVVTSTCPSFVYPSPNAFRRSKWFNNGKEVKNDFTNERKVLDKIYEKINDSDSKPYLWYYGRFKMGHNDKVNDILFNSLMSYQFVQVNGMLSSFFGIDTSKKVEVNTHTFEEVLRDESMNFGLDRYRPEDIDLPNLEDVEGEVEGGEYDEDEAVEDEPMEIERPRPTEPINEAIARGGIYFEPYNLNYTIQANGNDFNIAAAAITTDDLIGDTAHLGR